MILLGFNMIVLVASIFPLEDNVVQILDKIDEYFVYVFLIECVMKIIGLGIKEYFADNWNKFDFFLVMLSLMMNVTINMLKFAKNLKSAKSIKFIRISKSQRALRFLKNLKKFKAFNFILTSVATVSRIKNLIHRTMMCITSFKQITSVMVLTFYIYAVIGVQVFSTQPEVIRDLAENNENYQFYASNTIGGFQTFYQTFLALF